MSKSVICSECKHFRSEMMPWCIKYGVPVMTTIKSNGIVAGKAARCVKENGWEPTMLPEPPGEEVEG